MEKDFSLDSCHILPLCYLQYYENKCRSIPDPNVLQLGIEQSTRWNVCWYKGLLLTFFITVTCYGEEGGGSLLMHECEAAGLDVRLLVWMWGCRSLDVRLQVWMWGRISECEAACLNVWLQVWMRGCKSRMWDSVSEREAVWMHGCMSECKVWVCEAGNLVRLMQLLVNTRLQVWIRGRRHECVANAWMWNCSSGCKAALGLNVRQHV